MGTHNSDTIRNVVDRLNESFFVPDIQRSYVWLQNPKAKKIEQLFDSLMRGYPIGSCLFWKINRDDIETDNTEEETAAGKLNFQLYEFIENYDVRNTHNRKINVSQIKNNELHIVLDGQQRLTSLYIGLRGSRTLRKPYARSESADLYQTKYLYLNLRHKPQDDAPDDMYEFEFKLPSETRVEDAGTLWFRVSEVMKMENEDAIYEYCDKHNIGRTEENLIKKLYGAICSHTNITYFEETEKNLDKVLKIFIRVNSGGMQLSYSDLLMSLLTATFKSEIRDKMENLVDEIKARGFGCFGRDQVLKTCLMLADCNQVFKLQNFSKANIHKIEERWEDMIESINYALRFLSSIGYAGQLSSGYIATIIAQYLYQHKIHAPSPEDREAMTKFVRVTQMLSYFTAGLDGKLTAIKNMMGADVSFVELMKKMESELNVKVDAAYLEWAVDHVGYGSPAVLPLLQSLYPLLNYGSVTFHVDHIYPRSKYNDKTVGIPRDRLGRENHLFNLQLLEGKLNEEKSAKDPDKWVDEVYADEDKRKKYYEDNYIPEGFELKWQNLLDFETKRKELILNRLKKVFGVTALKAGE